MKKKLYIIALLLFTLFISCDREEPHYQSSDDTIILDEDKDKDPNIGVVLGFNTDGVISTKIKDLNIFFFDNSEKLTRHNYFTNMKEIAYTKLLMESGEYTVFAVFNTQEDFLGQITRAEDLPQLYLSGLVDKVNSYYENNTYPNMLTGMAQSSVDGSITQTIITISNEPVLDNITNVALNLIYPSVDMPVYTKSNTHTLRAVVELYKSGTTKLVSRKTFTSADDMKFTLTSGDYDVRVWSDYTFNKDEDLHYNTSQTNNISVISKENYTANSDYKDAFVGASTLTASGKEMNHTHTLKRPFAKYKIVSTDVEAYEKIREVRGYPKLDDLDIEITYEGYLPTAYNMVDAVLCGADTGYSFDSNTSDATSTQVTLATDYVLVNGESSVSVTIHIKDSDGNTISRVSGNTIKYKANHLTTISGNFLTAGNSGGINIDASFDGDINITID